MSRLIFPLLVSAFTLNACAGQLAPDGPDLFPTPDSDVGVSTATNCAEVVFTRLCPPGATVAKCVTGYMASPGACGSRMPFTATKALTSAEQACILAWIKNIPGVNGN